MEKEFVPYELAIKLKALGFDEPCFGYYGKGVLSIEIIKSGKIFTNEDSIYFDKDSSCLAPTFSQAFRWFREKNYYITINTYIGLYSKPFGIHIEFVYETGRMDWIDFAGESDFETYEEAELACLTKLIEIVETRTK